ncbi:cupin domain-containing protein [Marinobacterium sp. YM272]|uniref:cupin domain-containing protein n=1 Tax=Marinobacterium sp. YM272 TaxID=3421654 RepID=UPI003D7F5B1D
MKNLLAELPYARDDEVFQLLAAGRGVEIERIVSHGQSSPEVGWYDQDRHEWVMVLSGAARLEFEDEGVVEMNAGDSVAIPACCRHRVAWTTPDEPTIWLAVHYPADSAES